jgi:hypothetical protein
VCHNTLAAEQETNGIAAKIATLVTYPEMTVVKLILPLAIVTYN